MTQLDYSNTGLTIAQSLVDRKRRGGNSVIDNEPINWGGILVRTFDWWEVPNTGKIHLEFLHSNHSINQGFDIKFEYGGIFLNSGDRVPLLRTWRDDRFEDVLIYDYETSNGRMCVWNVYEINCGFGVVREEKWTNNAGFWIEEVGKMKKVYHCNAGTDGYPSFSDLVFSVSIFD